MRENLRIKRGLQSGSYFEDFACRALSYFHKNKKDWIRVSLGEGETQDDLVAKFYKPENNQLMPKRLKKQPTLEKIKQEMSDRENASK